MKIREKLCMVCGITVAILCIAWFTTIVPKIYQDIASAVIFTDDQGDFRFEGYSGLDPDNIVVYLKDTDPRQRLKALDKAILLIEKRTGRKVVYTQRGWLGRTCLQLASKSS